LERKYRIEAKMINTKPEEQKTTQNQDGNIQFVLNSLYTISQGTVTVEDINKFNQLSIQPKLLYMDALNYGSKIFGRNGDHWLIEKAVSKIRKLVKAATNSGWKLKVFIDAAIKTNETMKKWRGRREEEVRKECRAVAQGMNTLLGDAFRENGVEVLYSVEADNDDTLAAHASQDGAAILSGDQDFFRYRGLTCPIYCGYEIKGNKLILTLQQKNDKYVSKRNIISPPPKTTHKDPSLVDLVHGRYMKGAPSSLVKRMGNIHVVCRPLRQALYWRRGVKTPIVEIFPVWKDEQVFWLNDEVLPDEKLNHLLDLPEEALEALFPKVSLIKPDEVSVQDWENHLFSIHAVVFELCVLGGNMSEISLLNMLLPAAKKLRGNIYPKRDESELPAFETACKVCKVSIKLYKKEVIFYEKQGFSMPKKCKTCKQLKLEKPPSFKKENGKNSKREYGNPIQSDREEFGYSKQSNHPREEFDHSRQYKNEKLSFRRGGNGGYSRELEFEKPHRGEFGYSKQSNHPRKEFDDSRQYKNEKPPRREYGIVYVEKTLQ